MARASPLKTSWNAGELSPLLLGRPDLAKYSNGCRQLVNYIPLAQGGIKRRPGSQFVAAEKTQTKFVRLRRFAFSDDQAFILEFGDQYIRFYKSRAQITTAPSTPYEISTPYVEADLNTLQAEQSADVLYITSTTANYAPRTLTRASDTSWTLALLDVQGGPFRDRNEVTATTVVANAQTGSVTLTASAAVFVADDVGTLIRLEVAVLEEVKPWEPALMNPSGDEYCRYESRIYKNDDTKKVGSVNGVTPPTHIDGGAYDGFNNKRFWNYDSLIYGIAKITAVTNSTTATATVVLRLPKNVVGSGNETWKWSKGAWSAARGYPRALCFFQDRLVFGGTKAQPDTIWASQTGDYPNFTDTNKSGLVVASSSVELTTTSGEVNAIQWMASEQSHILVGTVGGEFLISAASAASSFGPANASAQPQSSYGSAPIQALRVGDATLFIQRSKRKLREAVFDFGKDRYIALDRTVLAEHISQGGLSALTWAPEPDAVIYATRADGQLLGLTYEVDQDVIAWHRHILGGWVNSDQDEYPIVESVDVIPAPNGLSDDIWISVKRYINGAVKRYVEVIKADWNFGTLEEATFLDSHKVTAGPITTVTGLGHLEGQEVIAYADGKPSTHTVASSQIVLDEEATLVTVGLDYSDRTIVQTMPPEAGATDGTAQGKLKRIWRVMVRLYKSGAYRYGPTESSMDLDDFQEADSNDDPPALLTGDRVLQWEAPSDLDAPMVIKPVGPLPLCILGMGPRLDVKDE